MLERRRSFLNKRTRRATMGQADTTKKIFFYDGIDASP